MKCFGSIDFRTKRSAIASCLLSVWFQGTGGLSTSKCGPVQHGSEHVGGASVLTRSCFHSPQSVWLSLCDSIAEGEQQMNLGRLESIPLCSSEGSWML